MTVRVLSAQCKTQRVEVRISHAHGTLVLVVAGPVVISVVEPKEAK